MGRLNKANLKKTIYYLRRNGLLRTYYAARERMEERPRDYTWEEPQAREIEAQRKRVWKERIVFSIVTPTYRTPEPYLREMIDSVLKQSYPYLELILADATEDDSVERVARAWGDDRIRYRRLERNAGIAENTNAGVEMATGDYIGLLDHDDLLTPDALYMAADRIARLRDAGRTVSLLYSDEDKCSRDRSVYYEPHRKEDFNLELLLSNNYICHFMILESSLMKRLGLREDFDGAQDYDLALRAVGELLPEEERIVHIGRVLYHWRCHAGSTAENPQSKQYAYEAGKRAVQAFLDARGWRAEVYSLPHLGFYGLRYQPDLLTARPDVGAVGGRLLAGNRVAAGAYREDGGALYHGLHFRYSGYMHRASLVQEAAAVDIRFIKVRPECRELFERVTGTAYRTAPGGDYFDKSLLPKGTDYKRVSLALGSALREQGYRVVWDPCWSRREAAVRLRAKSAKGKGNV